MKLKQLLAELDYAREQLKLAKYADEQNWWHRILYEINVEIAEFNAKNDENTTINEQYEQKRQSF